MKKIISLVLLMLLMGTMAFAEGGLTLISNSIEDGQTDVSVQADFILEFSDNIAGQDVKDSNLTMLEMADKDGNQVPLTLEIGDDQDDSEIKNYIKVQVESPLIESSMYTLKIKKDLQSTDGATLGEDMIITFTTGKVAQTSTFTAMIMAALGMSIGYIISKRRK